MANVMGGISAFTGLIGMARGLKDINDAVVRNEAIYELTGKLLDAQQEYAEQIEKVRALEAKLASYENWESEKERYELTEDEYSKVITYSLKEGAQPSEPSHSICPDCYQQRKKSIIQPERRVGGTETLVCRVCGWEAFKSGFATSRNANSRR
ncbi:hypothetical protein [Reyranella sp.]|uniref:hypothetical protein n=1 Tax=Reyranella sp. TaxID=1929291 RepID=UPI001225E75E|nr:hypothetical protein [Reyranella sp.]TAJ84550.1 MAG: hypothetical protein EPO50_17830 [Reyranella sp.]